MSQRILLVISAAAWITCGALGAELGEPAPQWKLQQWVTGQPRTLEQALGKKVQVVTFWDSGCPACRDALPHLMGLKGRFGTGNVDFMAITTEAASFVRGYLTNTGVTNGFDVAVDDFRQTYEAYMTAYGATLIPHSFIVGTNGTILWHGHPKAGLEQALEEVVSGKFDLAVAKKTAHAENLRKDYISLVASEHLAAEAKQLGDRVVSDGAKNPWLLNNFAWEILTDEQIKNRDRDLALRAAKAACDSTGQQNPSFLDTYARALFDLNQIDDAVKVQTKAVEVCKEGAHRTALEATLKSYQEAAAKRGK